MKFVFIAAGSFFLILGMIGVALPILPTTPFLILASFCYLRGSKSLYSRLMTHPFLGPRLRRIQEGQGLTKREKLVSFLLASAMIIPIIIFSHSIHLRIFLLLLLIAKAIVFIRMKTAAPDTTETSQPGADFK